MTAPRAETAIRPVKRGEGGDAAIFSFLSLFFCFFFLLFFFFLSATGIPRRLFFFSPLPAAVLARSLAQTGSGREGWRDG